MWYTGTTRWPSREVMGGVLKGSAGQLVFWDTFFLLFERRGWGIRTCVHVGRFSLGFLVGRSTRTFSVCRRDNYGEAHVDRSNFKCGGMLSVNILTCDTIPRTLL